MIRRENSHCLTVTKTEIQAGLFPLTGFLSILKMIFFCENLILSAFCIINIVIVEKDGVLIAIFGDVDQINCYKSSQVAVKTKC